MLTKIRQFWFVRLKEATESSYVFVSWLPRVAIGILVFYILNIIFTEVSVAIADGGGWSAYDLYFIAVLFLILVVGTLFSPYTEKLIFNIPDKIFIWRRETLANRLGIIRQKEKCYSLDELNISWNETLGIQALTLTTNTKEKYLILDIRGEMGQVKAFKSWLVGPGEEIPQEQVNIIQDNVSKSNQKYLAMLKEIKIWRIVSFVLGIVHLVVIGNLNPSWGVTLVIVGLITFWIKGASVFMVFAGALAWVGLSNIVYGGISQWSLFGLIQIYLGYVLYKKFRKYQQVEQEYLATSAGEEGEDPDADRAAKYFPRAGCSMSALGFVGFVGYFIIFILLIAFEILDDAAANYEQVYFILELLVGLGVPGFSVSVAALLSGYKPKWMAWGGVIAGGLVILLEIGLFILGSV